MGRIRYAWQRLYAGVHTRYLTDFVFVHINKTGGSSIEKALGLPFQHKTARELRDELGRQRWERRFSFAFVRNPWDKVASHYHFRVLTNQTSLGADPIGFNEWVVRAYGENDPRYFDRPKMFMPQVEWVSDERGRIIVDFIGRFERLEEDFRKVSRILEREAALPHLKKSRDGDYRALFTSEAADVVERWFARDIAAFGYSFE